MNRLGARNSLRLEAGLCLHGNDISEDTTPSEAVLMWTVRKYSNIEFIGQQALKAKKAKRKRVGYVSDGKGIIRDGSKVLNQEGEEVGYVSSGSYGPSVQKGVGMAYVNMPYHKVFKNFS